MAESAKQEIEFSFGGKAYKVRPTFDVIISIEAAIGLPAQALGLKMLRTEASLTEIAAILFHVLKGQAGAPTTPNAVGEIMMEDGYGDLLLPLGLFLTRALRGNREHMKEAAQGAASADPPQTEG